MNELDQNLLILCGPRDQLINFVALNLDAGSDDCDKRLWLLIAVVNNSEIIIHYKNIIYKCLIK